eukprot:TRINITY_DN6115_c0_g1_i1.p1 TRINITY_DN6115_c0_g1~~TRINITY_DN6115_c0_g1_i1.p1  ORF type:complete len:155 (-),score=5.59 TRINITY_DN6115_c0_g1_i1:65-529(-)
MLNHTLKESDNLFAERFMMKTGGIASCMMGFPKKMIDNSGVYVDGSGLSRHNLQSPFFFDLLFQLAVKDNHGDDFIALLPQAGVSGTLRHRFQNSNAKVSLLWLFLFETNRKTVCHFRQDWHNARRQRSVGCDSTQSADYVFNCQQRWTIECRC